MSQVEFLLVGTDQPFDVVAARVGELLGVESDRSSGDVLFPLSGGGWAVLDCDAVDPWEDDRLRGYRWQITVGGLVQDGPERQQAAARQVYRLLSAGTTWDLALTYDHADALVAARSASAPQTGHRA